jgi:hypothetical protein
MLYGLVHQRYILTRAGLQAMVRVLCQTFSLMTQGFKQPILGREV